MITAEIDDPKKWRISMTGCSIRTGWGNEKKIVAKCPTQDTNSPAFTEWLDNAQAICDAHNRALQE